MIAWTTQLCDMIVKGDRFIDDHSEDLEFICQLYLAIGDFDFGCGISYKFLPGFNSSPVLGFIFMSFDRK